jgi:hypothetical protein
MHFKIEGAKTEIERLNVEIRRFLTYISDEDPFISKKVEEVSKTNPMLAHQLFLYHQGWSRFDPRHLKKLLKLSQNPQFTGSISRLRQPNTPPPKPGHTGTSEDASDSGEEDSDKEVDDVAETMDSVLAISVGD